MRIFMGINHVINWSSIVPTRVNIWPMANGRWLGESGTVEAMINKILTT